MDFETLFSWTQPLREFLFDNCDPKDFCALLCASWPLYSSFRRKSAAFVVEQLQLSDIFWTRYVLDITISESEFCRFVKSLCAAMTYNGERFTLFHPDWHAPAIQRRVSIDCEAWMAVYLKFYDSPWQTASRTATLDRGFVPIADEPNDNADVVDTADWIVSELRSENVFVDGRTRFINRQLHKFVFWSRVARFSAPHMQWLRDAMQTDVASLYNEYMLKVGFDQRI